MKNIIISTMFFVLLFVMLADISTQAQSKTVYYGGGIFPGNLYTSLSAGLYEFSGMALKVSPPAPYTLSHTGAQIDVIHAGDFGANDLIVDASKKIYLDGGGNTYIVESNADRLSFFAGGVECAEFRGGGLQLQTIAEITATNDGSGGSQIPDGASRVSVVAVANDADDYVVLPWAFAGTDIYLYCDAGSDFELRVASFPGSETINNVNSDGTNEYLCTDTDIIHLHCHKNGAWIAQSWEKDGSLRAAVVPD